MGQYDWACTRRRNHVVATGSQVPARSGRTAGRVGGAVVGGLLTLALLSGCSVQEAFSFGWPRGGISTQSHRMFDLWIGSAIAALAVGVFVWGLIFWCIIRYRKRGDELPPQTRYNLPIELIYSVAPFLVVSVLFYYTVVVQNDVNRLGTPDIIVNVEPSKWNWTFAYPDTKGADNKPVSTIGSSDYIPVLVVPTNKRIEFVEHSPDVIHSFWVPALLFKRDVFPGNVVNRFQTSILTPGAYVGRCAELCGTYHSMMNFELRAVTPEQFDKFLAAKKLGLSTPQALASIGQEPFATTTVPFPTKRDADVVNN
jgi:cytochrome c oxidase subunit 2